MLEFGYLADGTPYGNGWDDPQMVAYVRRMTPLHEGIRAWQEFHEDAGSQPADLSDSGYLSK